MNLFLLPFIVLYYIYFKYHERHKTTRHSNKMTYKFPLVQFYLEFKFRKDEIKIIQRKI